MNIDKMPKFLSYSNMTLDQILEKMNDPDLKEHEFEYCLKALEFVKRKVEDAYMDYQEFSDQTLNENKIKSFSEILKLKEGGHRRHISKELRDKFIHNVLIIPNPEDRQSEIDSIFQEIAEKNQAAYLKSHPELEKERAENLEESKKG